MALSRRLQYTLARCIGEKAIQRFRVDWMSETADNAADIPESWSFVVFPEPARDAWRFQPEHSA